jgi:UDP-glucose 4-epimerase
MKKILVTGGTGYIGSHTVVKLIEAGYEVVILDNLFNSKVTVIDRIQKITNKRPLFIEGDIRDRPLLKKIFNDHEIDAVIHFAGLKAVGESVLEPLKYYVNNVGGSISLLEAMKDANVKNIIFSSSATVYGEPQQLPITEDHPLNPTNPYGETKLAVENLLRDLYRSSPSWEIFILRYFNPVGAHQSGLIGEDPNDIPNNLFPYIAKVASGDIECLKVFGDDYKTKDGTGIRDYIHVIDLAEAHLKALEKLSQSKCQVINVGTGQGYSVLEIVKAFQKISDYKINFTICERRSGDVAICYADASLARVLLNWKVKYNLDQMCKDSWLWQYNLKQNGKSKLNE